MRETINPEVVAGPSPSTWTRFRTALSRFATDVNMDSSKKADSQCPHCGANDFIRAVKLSQPVQTGSIGLVHRKALVFDATETLLADLCKACGTVTRFYVRETNRNWLTG
jgi:hypothetical protein